VLRNAGNQNLAVIHALRVAMHLSSAQKIVHAPRRPKLRASVVGLPRMSSAAPRSRIQLGIGKN
jgi:hypothetical protein